MPDDLGDGQLALGDLTPDPANAREHTPRNVGLIVDALQEVGAARSIVVDEDNVVLAGNATVEAAAEAGFRKVRVIEADGTELIAVRRRGLTPEQKARLALYDNRAAELARWSPVALRALSDLGQTKGLFTPEEIEALCPPRAGAPGGDPEAVPAARETSIRPGDCFVLGDHRLICGDSTDPLTLDALLGTDRVALVYTDPPYGVDYDGGTTVRPSMAGDDTADLYEPACRMAHAFSQPDAALYLWHAATKADTVMAALALAGYLVRAQIVWNKNLAQYGALGAQYKPKHEPIFYCYKKGHAPRWYGPTTEVTVWDCARASVNEFHPTQKPVELASRALTNSSLPGDLVLDLFLGSGATLIACEQTGRHGRGVELDPVYCQVIVDRWEGFTGRKAERL